MVYRIIAVPDNSDAWVKDYKTFDAAAEYAATIIRDYETDWPAHDIKVRLKEGASLGYHDHSEIRIDHIE